MIRPYRIKVVIADDQPAVLSGLRRWFASRERYRVSGSARDAAQLLEKMARQGGDLIVMNGDLDASSRAGANDFALLRTVRERYPDVPVVVFCADTDASTLRALQSAGAAGIVSKQEEMRDLERVCDRVLSGATGVVSRRVAAMFQTARTFDTPPMYGHVRLSVKPFAATAG
jgi:DNA-binding NarL/FixJ family response regulator